MVYGVILAGGAGKRMGSSVPKQYIEVCGKPVLAYSLLAFENSMVDRICVVIPEKDDEFCKKDIVEKYGIKKCVCYANAGKERYDSVLNGLDALARLYDITDTDIVLIHDGARPLITSDMIDDQVLKTYKKKAVVSGYKSVDTVQITDEDGRIVETPDRKTVWNAQTPQSFFFNKIHEGYRLRAKADDNTLTDDASVYRKYIKEPVFMTEGSKINIKITTNDDLDTIGLNLSKIMENS